MKKTTLSTVAYLSVGRGRLPRVDYLLIPASTARGRLRPHRSLLGFPKGKLRRRGSRGRYRRRCYNTGARFPPTFPALGDQRGRPLPCPHTTHPDPDREAPGIPLSLSSRFLLLDSNTQPSWFEAFPADRLPAGGLHRPPCLTLSQMGCHPLTICRLALPIPVPLIQPFLTLYRSWLFE